MKQVIRELLIESGDEWVRTKDDKSENDDKTKDDRE
jgi:hypothetical protein